jgi:ApaG protein
MVSRPFHCEETHGFRVFVRPTYLPDESDVTMSRYVFAYTVRIENCSKQPAQLRSRHWYITDSIGEQYTVVGDGVVGQQPWLRPGDVHEYRSFCVLKSAQGTMSGFYTFVNDDDIAFDAIIPLFELATPHS